jgi:hypothetical protein
MSTHTVFSISSKDTVDKNGNDKPDLSSIKPVLKKPPRMLDCEAKGLEYTGPIVYIHTIPEDANPDDEDVKTSSNWGFAVSGPIHRVNETKSDSGWVSHKIEMKINEECAKSIQSLTDKIKDKCLEDGAQFGLTDDEEKITNTIISEYENDDGSIDYYLKMRYKKSMTDFFDENEDEIEFDEENEDESNQTHPGLIEIARPGTEVEIYVQPNAINENQSGGSGTISVLARNVKITKPGKVFIKADCNEKKD